jgi:hypothetical protein
MVLILVSFSVYEMTMGLLKEIFIVGVMITGCDSNQTLFIQHKIDKESHCHKWAGVKNRSAYQAR